MSTLRPTIPGDLNQDLDDANVDKTMRPAEGLVSPDVAPVTEKTMRPAEPMTTPMVEDLSADGEYFILKGERYHNHPHPAATVQKPYNVDVRPLPYQYRHHNG